MTSQQTVTQTRYPVFKERVLWRHPSHSRPDHRLGWSLINSQPRAPESPSVREPRFRFPFWGGTPGPLRFGAVGVARSTFPYFHPGGNLRIAVRGEDTRSRVGLQNRRSEGVQCPAGNRAKLGHDTPPPRRQLICNPFTFTCRIKGHLRWARYRAVICRVVAYIPLPRIHSAHYGHCMVPIVSAFMHE